jgi:hypothetical protein
MEIWKDVKGYEGLYQVSNLGNIKSFFKVNKEKILKKKKIRGYNYVSLYKDKKYKNFRICRLVALNFIENIENKEQVNHIDGIKINDFLSNLEWCTRSENMKHAYNKNLIKIKKGSECKNSIKIKCLKTNKTFESILEASKYVNISSSHLSRILNGKYKNKTNLIKIYA